LGGAGPQWATGISEIGSATAFDPAVEPQTSYMAADEAGRPIHLARALVDADVVVSIGQWGLDAAFGGRSFEGELWPTFSRRSCREELVCSLAKRGRRAVDAWMVSNHEATWHGATLREKKRGVLGVFQRLGSGRARKPSDLCLKSKTLHQRSA
jgi:hypothetical protein